MTESGTKSGRHEKHQVGRYITAWDDGSDRSLVRRLLSLS